MSFKKIVAIAITFLFVIGLFFYSLTNQSNRILNNKANKYVASILPPFPPPPHKV